MRYFGAPECSGIGSVIAHLYAHSYLSAVEGTVLYRQVIVKALVISDLSRN